jgi:GT2 family glycosyltransferase
MIAVVIPTCSVDFVPPNYGSISVFVIFDDPKNSRGFASSCNLGLAKAHAQGFRWILICNDDASISREDILQLMQNIDDGIGVIAPVITDDKGIQSAGIVVSSWGRVQLLRTPLSEGFDALSGACFLIPAWARFDDGYSHGFEDIALCSLLKKRGKGLKLVRDVRCHHDGGGTIVHHSRIWFAHSVYGHLRFFSSSIHAPLIVGLAMMQARRRKSSLLGVLDGWLLWRDQRRSRVS